MTDKIACTIPGNVVLELEGCYKLMTLIHVYGIDKIAMLLSKENNCEQLQNLSEAFKEIKVNALYQSINE